MNDKVMVVLTLIGLILLLVGAVGLGVYYYTKTSGECTKDPIGFYNNNTELFGYKGTAMVFSPDSIYQYPLLD